MEFRILGPLEAVEHERAIPLGGARQRALLALLLTRANEVVSADRLINELWGEQPPQAPLNALQYHVSQLRKALGRPDAIVTRTPGYLLKVEAEELDLFRFERLVAAARVAEPDAAASLLREALALWRGTPLADLAYEEFARPEIARLEELRLAAIELRIEADLALAGHADVAAELEALVGKHPFRENLRAQLMLALYRCGRQAEALAAYQEGRRVLVDGLGVEPGPALRDLEQAILRQEEALDAPGALAAAEAGAILVVVSRQEALDELLAIAEPLARSPELELIVARLLAGAEDLAAANAALVERRVQLAERGVTTRVAAYTTPQPASEAILLATENRVNLLVVDAPPAFLDGGGLDENTVTILAGAPCDVALLVPRELPGEGPVVTPFGGADHEWSAIELAAWLASALRTPLRLLGTEAAGGRRDASRLLARASLMVQQVVGIATEPVLVARGEHGIAAGADGARLLVLGVSERWRSEGVGDIRLAVARRSTAPTIFVRRGVRPSGVAPSETLTRFTWTLASETSHRDHTSTPR